MDTNIDTLQISDLQHTRATLFAKLATVMGQCRTLEKSGRNQFDKYDYVTADAIAHRIGSLLAEVGIAFLPSIVNVQTEEYTTQKGAANFRSIVHMQMTFACTDSGATYTSLWSGEAIDRSDKSISKAAVSATKYFLLKTFLVTGGNEEDADADSPQVQTRKPAPAYNEPPAPDDDLVAPAASLTAQGSPAGGLAEIWDTPADHAKKPDALSQSQLTKINVLGNKLHPAKGEWDAERPRYVEFVTKGAITSAKELKPQEAEVLIAAMERKLAKLAGEIQSSDKQTNGNGHKVAA